MHEWAIDPRQYERHEARRGRRHAYERIDPPRTVLVVVDIVPFFVEQNACCRGILPNIARLADGLRRAGGTVAWVAPAVAPPSDHAIEFYGSSVAELYAGSGGSGSVLDRIWEGFEPRDDDLFVEKSAASAFFPGRSPLPELLANRGIDTVLVTGTVTNVCCESTARDASTLGYRVVMVADANAASCDASHNATLHVVYRSFGDVRPTSEILAMIDDGVAASAN